MTRRRLALAVLLALVVPLAAGAWLPAVAQPPTSPTTTAAPTTTAGPTPVSTTVPPATAAPPTSIGPEGIRITRGLVMVTIPGTPPTDLTVDVYQPAEGTPEPNGGRPAVVLVHGGSWFQGDTSMMDPEGTLLARQGWVGFSISYRFAKPEKPSFPDAVGDVQRGVRWVAAHAKDFGATPDRLAMIGSSAGGHLAALVAALGTDPIVTGPLSSPAGALPFPATDPPAKLKVVATFSAPFVLADLVPNQNRPPFTCGSNEYCQKFWIIPLVKNLLGCEYRDCKDTYEKASPVNRVSADTTPMWMANADDEIVPIGQMQLMGDALIANRVDHDVMIVEGHAHADEYVDQVWNSMVPFLADRLGVVRPAPVSFPTKNDGPGGGLGLALVALAVLLLLGGVGAAALTGREEGRGSGPGGGPGPGPSRGPTPREPVGAAP